MSTRINGIMPVMLTPFTAENEIDWAGLERLVEWYLDHGADALFAVAQSSEMQFLSLREREALAQAVVRQVAGRVPVAVSGHISDDVDDQVEELMIAAKTGADAVILVTNHLDPQKTGRAETFNATLDAVLARLPRDMPLGLYECPAPYRRLLADDELRRCVDTGRFVVLKDVSCDLTTVKRRVAMTEGSPLSVINANAAIAWDAMQAGARGFSGVHTNYHPDLYQWLLTSGTEHPALRARLVPFLAMAALSEAFGYPAQAKLLHQRLGTFKSAHCRVIDFDVRERFWALDAVLDQLMAGTELFRSEIRSAVSGDHMSR